MAEPFRAQNGSSVAAADKENPEPPPFSEQISPIHQQPQQAVGEGPAQVVAPTPAGNDPNAAAGGTGVYSINTYVSSIVCSFECMHIHRVVAALHGFCNLCWKYSNLGMYVTYLLLSNFQHIMLEVAKHNRSV